MGCEPEQYVVQPPGMIRGRQLRTPEFGPPESRITCLHTVSAVSSGLLRTSAMNLGVFHVFILRLLMLGLNGDMPRAGMFIRRSVFHPALCHKIGGELTDFSLIKHSISWKNTHARPVAATADAVTWSGTA